MNHFFRAILFTSLLFLISFRAVAVDTWLWGVEYQSIDSEIDFFGTNIDFDVSAIGVNVGYQSVLSDPMTMTHSISIGTGVKQDNNIEALVFGDIGAEIDMKLSTYFRFQSQFDYALSESSKVFIAPGINRYDFSAKQNGFNSESFADWQISVSAGYTHRLSSNSAIKIAYTYFSDSNIFALAYEKHY